jgi:septal ring factor EnvC (AmiA/AmiB activator)
MTAPKKPKDDPYELYDAISQRRRELCAMIEDAGAGLRAIEEAALAGRDPLEAAMAQPTGQQLSNAVQAIDDAKRALAQRACEAEVEARGVSAPRIQYLPRDAGELREHVAGAIARADEARGRDEAQRDDRRRYDAALSWYHEVRGELIREGVPPEVASERAKQQLGDQADDLWPTGAPGPLRLVGRDVASTVMPV